MAKSLPLPDGTSVTIREGETPEETWLRAIREYPEAFQPPAPATEPAGPTIGGQTKEFFKGVLPGGIGLVEQAGVGISALLPEEQESIAQQYIREKAAAAKAPFAAAPGYEDTIGRKFGEAAGSIVPFLATGPFGVAGRLAGYGLGIGAGAGTQVEKSAAEGATAGEQTAATALGAVVGASEMFAPVRILKRIGEPAAEGAVAFIKRALMAGGEEAAQEAAAQAAQNLITKGIYKPEQEIIEQVGESAAYGGAVGGLAQGLLDLALGRRVPGASLQQDQQPASEAAAIPEPTLREVPAPESAMGTPEAELLKEAIAPKKKAAMDKQLAKDQQAYLEKYHKLAQQREADQAERERIAGMSPQEYMEELAQTVKASKPVKGMPIPTGETPISEAEGYAMQQLALAKDREPYAETGTYVNYLMVNPAMARQLALSEQPIPGLNTSTNYKVKNAILSALEAQDKAAARVAAQAKEAGAVRGQQLLTQTGAQTNQELLGAARETTPAQAQAWERAERERIDAQERAEKDRIAKLTPEEYKAELSQVRQEPLPEEEPAPAEEPLLEQLFNSLPRDQGRVTPGQVYEGLGTKRGTLKDLQLQLAIARMTENTLVARRLQAELNDRRKELKEPIEQTGSGQLTRELPGATEGVPKVTPESRAKQIEADKFADEQRSTMLGLVKTLNTRNPLNPSQTRRSATLSLPGVFEKRVSDAKEAFAAAHANEIEARRAVFGLPPMADWERAEARARSLEALNELEGRWNTFGAPIEAVQVLQQQVRDATNQNLLNATKRLNQEARVENQEKIGTPGQKYTNYKGEPINVPRETGPRVGAPKELTLKATPRRAGDERQDALNLIETVLRSVERRTRGVPVAGEKPPTRVGSMEDIAKLFEKEKTKGASEKTDPATIELLSRLRDHLETSADPEFISLAREQAQQVMEGNLPNPFAVRDLNEMMLGREVAGRSESKPLSKEDTAAVARGEQKYEAQPQKDLFPEANVQVVRATPANFQRLLDSKDIQGMREALNMQKEENKATLEQIKKYVPSLQRDMQAATSALNKALAKKETLTQAAAEATGEPDWFAPAVRKIVELESLLQSVPPRLDSLRNIQRAIQGLNEKDKAALLELAENAHKTAATPDERADFNEIVRALKTPEAFNAEIKMLNDAVKNANKLIDSARNALDDLMTQYRSGATVRKSLEREASKATREVERLTKSYNDIKRELAQERAAREAEEKAKIKQAPEEQGLSDKEYKDAAQRGREGMGLPGVRAEKDTTRMRENMNKIRSEIGSLNEELRKAEKAENTERMEELQNKIDDAETRLASVYRDAPLNVKELLTLEEARDARAAADRLAAEDAAAGARRRKRKGEKAPKLVPIEQTSLLKEVRGSKITQPYKTARVTETAEKVTDRLIEQRTALAELQRRIAYLKDNNKHKAAGRLTDAFKDLQGKEALLKEKLKKTQASQSTIVRIEKEAETKASKEAQKQALSKSKAAEKESERFARGVEIESPDLTAAQISAIEENDVTAAYADIANDKSNSEVNRAVAQRLAALLDDTDIAIRDKLTDQDGKEVLGMATSKTIGLNRNGGLSQEVFLHEGVHAATERVIQLPEGRLTRTQLIAKRELMALHNVIKNDPSFTSISAKSSLSEFVAEAMSNRNLQEQLRGKKWKMSDAWEGFKSIVLRMLGIQHPETMLGAALQSVDALMVPSSVDLGVEETAVNRRLSQKDIAALHDGSNSMKQFADQFGKDIKQKDRTPDDVERIAKDYLTDMERSPDKYISAPTEDSLDYKAQTIMSDGKPFDIDNPLHYVEADVTTFAALQALDNKRLRVKEAEEIRKQREKDLKSLIRLMASNTSYTLAENALVAKAASKYAVLSDKTGRLKLATIAENNRHNVAVVSLDAADAVIRELRAGKNLKEAFLDGMQISADRAAKENETKEGWQKFDQGDYDEQEARQPIREGVLARPYRKDGTQQPPTRALKTTVVQDKIIEKENNRRQDAGEPLLELQGNIDPTIDFLEDYYRALEASPNKNESLAIKLSKGCAGTPWCTAGESTARSQLKRGDFYVYYRQGKPEVAVRMNGKNDIAEVRGNSPNQALNKEQQEIAAEFLKKKNFANGEEYLNEFAAKEKLIKVAQGKAEITPDDLANAGRLFDFEGKLNKFQFERFFSFSTVDGHTRLRPEPSDKVTEFFAKKYKVAADEAFENGYLYYSALYTSDFKNNVSKLEFGDKTKTFSLDEIKAVRMLSVLGNTKEITFPNLRTVMDLTTFNGVVNLPQAQKIDTLFSYANKKDEPAKVVLPATAYINKIRTSSSSETFLVVEGPKHIGTVQFYNSFGALNISLPDTLYVEGSTNFGSVENMFSYKIKEFLNAFGEQEGIKKASEEFADLYEGDTGETEIAVVVPDNLSAFGKTMIDRFNTSAKQKFGAKLFKRLVDDNDLQVAGESNDPFAYIDAFNSSYGAYLEEQAGRELNGQEEQKGLVTLAELFNDAYEISTENKIKIPKASADMPSRIADTPPVQELVERTAERPVYARAQAEGFENELNVASQVIAKPKTIGQQINANLGLSFRTQYLDRLAPLHKVAKDMLEPLKGMQMMHYLLASDQRMSYVQQAVGNGVPQRVAYKRPDGRTEYIVESVAGANLANVVRTLAKAPGMNGEAANQLFTLYLLGKRGDRVGYDKLNFSVNADLIKGSVRNIESNKALRDVFEEARTEYNKYNKNLMNFLKDTGVLPPSVADELAATNDYIPYYRERNGNAELVIGKEGTYKIGNLADQPQLRELIGGEDKILDFATSSVQNTSMILDVGLRNLAAKNAMYELVGLDLAQFLGKDTAAPDVVRFKDKGEEKFVRVATDTVGIPADLLVKGMEGIPVNTNALVRAMGFASSTVRKGVMLSPLYPVRQLLRDSVAAPLLSGADFAGPLGALKKLGAGETKTKLETRGITGGQVYTGTNEDLARILKDLIGGRMGLSQFVAKAEAIAMEADAATRRAQYDSYIRQGLSQMEATVMSLESMNFNKRGLSPSVHFVSTMIPFFNSQLQGLDVLWRAIRGDMPMSKRLDIQGKLLRRGSLVMATAVAYALLMQDDEAYKNARPEEKYGNFFIRVPGLDEPIRFPVPFEIGYILKGIPEAIVNTMASKQGGEEAWKAFKSIAIQTIPGGSSMMLPALIKPIIENTANYSFFGQRELETKREQGLLPQQRFRDNTSELSKEIGALVGYSPIKIDNLIRGYTGTMGLAAAQAVSFAMPEKLGPQEATKRLSDTPVIGSMFQPNDAGGIINATYERMEQIMEVKRTYDDMLKSGETAEARAFLQENVNEIASASIAGNAKTQLAKVTQAMNAVKASSMSPEEKRATLDRLQKLRIQIASSMRNVLDKTAPQ